MNCQKISSKWLNIESLKVINKSLFSNYKLLIMTSYGLVAGIPSEIKDDFNDDEDAQTIISNIVAENGTYNLDFNMILPIKRDLLENLADGKPIELVSDGSMLFLEDVQIFKDNLLKPVFSINNFALHSDSILGFSLIPKDHLG